MSDTCVTHRKPKEYTDGALAEVAQGPNLITMPAAGIAVFGRG